MLTLRDASRSLRETGQTLQAIVRVLQDSTRTEDIIFVEQTTNRHMLRQALKRLRRLPEGRRLLAERPEIVPAQVDYDALRQLPAHTLGGAYARHLDDNGLSPELMAVANVVPMEPDLDYLMRRLRQSHDVFHPLTGLGTQPYQEVVIHAFTFGQLRLPHSLLIVMLGGIKHLVLEGRWEVVTKGLLQAHEAGLRADFLLGVRWEDHWDEPLDDVQRRYRITPCPM